MVDKHKISTWASRAVQVMSDAADVAVMAKSSPGIIGGAAIAARIGNSLLGYAKSSADTYFNGDDWAYQSKVIFNTQLFRMAKVQGLLTEAQSMGNGPGKASVFIGVINGVMCGWIEYDKYVDGPWTQSSADVAVAIFRQFLWESMGPAIRIETTMSGEVLLPDRISDILPSKVGDDLHADLKAFNDANITRSVLFYGEPGTGKSTLMRYIAKLAGGLTVRIRAQELSSVRGITAAINLLQPSAVVIDDLDRIDDPDHILTEIEEVKGEAKLLLCSVNDITALDPAVLRVGRFDECVEIKELDAAIRRRLIGQNIDQEIVERLWKLPIAWIDEFHKVRTVLGDKAACKKVTEMAARHEMILDLMYEGDDEDEDNDVQSNLKSKSPPDQAVDPGCGR